MRKILALAGVALVVAAVAFTPTRIGADARRMAAGFAVRSDLPALGVALLVPLAKAGDPVAQNNLGILYKRGLGAARDPEEAARLMNAAAASGRPRAEMNLMLARASCSMATRPETLSRLEEFARKGDRRAASLAADCLTWASLNADGYGRVLAMAKIATGSSDPDEELKFGWLLLKGLGRIEDRNFLGHALRLEVATAAAIYLFRAAEHGQAAAYEGLSQIAAKYAALITDDNVAKRLAAKTPDEWIDTAAEAGHPRSRCVVGVRLATQLAARNTRASDSERQKLAGLFQTCLKDRDPRLMVVRNGREQTAGHWRLFDVWMMDDEFLVVAPRYDNYNHDPAAQDMAVQRIAKLAKEL